MGQWGANKILRRAALTSLSFLPAERQIRANRWLRGRHEFRKLRQADCAIVSFPKSGRTWIRVMISRYLQTHFGLEETELLGLKNLHRKNPAIPRVFFTHDNYLGDYTGNLETKADFYDKKVVLLVRDPRDVAVSSFHQRKFRPNPDKRGLRDIEVDGDAAPSLFEFVRFRVPRIVAFLNAWQADLANVKDHLVVRYEDVRAKPGESMADLLAFLGLQGSDEAIADAVEFASFNNLKKLESEAAFGAGDRRMVPGDSKNPESYKVRRAKVGGYRDYFTDDEVAELDRLVSEHLSAYFGYGDGGVIGPLGGAETEAA